MGMALRGREDAGGFLVALAQVSVRGAGDEAVRGG